ncbi:MAG: transporter substrate-binding protein [Amycolatopsis sp.]|jgi:phospholipid/cholesterol/gamma-HCH transport system substrate-binding protein|uniref:MCE family protein n=1 Tax=Amycolatopsis sp. TaxID=37632 RepID=UPI0026093231|nr:MCE family protein [Amycolatopsis sp.]MCU1686440.1 transporter substrate-binding protein [Amycolatopsis sp.]
MKRQGLRKWGVRTAGVLFLVVLTAFVTLSIMIYNKDFVAEVPVTLKTDTIGNQLQAGGDVKARGVVVGEIRGLRSTSDGAEIDLAMEPDKVQWLPTNVSALLVPKTLFGERYVQLSIPEASSAPKLAAGDVINQDHSSNAVELEKVFDNLLPVLQAVQPQKLATTLTAVAGALQGRGKQLGDTITQAANYLDQFNPDLPKLDQGMRDLATAGKLYGDIAPDLLDALTSSAVTLATVKEKQADLAALYPQVTSSAQDIQTFLKNNQVNLIGLAADSRAPLQVAAEYSPSFPCTLKAMTALEPSMDKVLGKGTNEPGLHVDVQVTQSRGKYVPGRDDPVYNASGGPRCYPSGVVPTTGTAAVAPGSDAQPLMPGGAGDLGVANSPQERELIATLTAPALGVPTSQVPAWSSVLVGPLYRGTQVTVR